jgi:hypothetical protein
MLAESIPLAPPVHEQMNADIRHRLNLHPPPRPANLASLPVNKRPLALARTPARFFVKMDFGPHPSDTPGRYKLLLFKPLQVALITALILTALFYTMSVSKLAYSRVQTFKFDSGRPLVVSAANCRLVMRPLNASEPNTLEVRASFTRRALTESFQTRFSPERNSVYLWQPSSPEACQVVIGVDRLTSPLSLALNCFNECSVVTDMPQRFEMGELLLKGRSLVVGHAQRDHPENGVLRKAVCGEPPQPAGQKQADHRLEDLADLPVDGAGRSRVHRTRQEVRRGVPDRPKIGTDGRRPGGCQFSIPVFSRLPTPLPALLRQTFPGKNVQQENEVLGGPESGGADD